MKKTNLFIIIFLLSVIMASPFMIKKLKDEKYVSSTEIIENDITENNEIINSIEKNNAINQEITNNVVSQSTEKNNTVINSTVTNSTLTNNTVNQNKITQNENKQTTDNDATKIDSKDKSKKFEKVDDSYFKDALFIGDSRTVGIAEYGELKNATFFANTGMSVYNLLDKTTSVPSVGKVKLDDLLSRKKFGKIYIMLGINELGYNLNNTAKKYKEIIEYIENKQNNAIIYIEANLHVTKEKSDSDKIFNNKNIDKLNREFAKLANNKTIFYLNINEKFDDENGNLKSDYTHDNVHIYAKYYKEWSEWIKQHAIK